MANATQVVSLDKKLLTERVAKLGRNAMASLMSGIQIIFGRWPRLPNTCLSSVVRCRGKPNGIAIFASHRTAANANSVSPH